MPVRKIFLAEDSSGDAFLFEQALRASGCEFSLSVAKDGAEAISVLMAAHPGQFDLVVLDLNLPKQSGESVLAALQLTNLGSYLPIVVLTSSDSSAERARTRSLGAHHFFVKPFRLAEFYEVGRSIKRIIDDSAQSEV